MSQPHKCRMAIVDDHKAFTDGLRIVLKKIDFINLIGIYHTVQEYLPILKTKKLDIVLMDIDIKNSVMNGIEATKETILQSPKTKVIALSMHEDNFTVQKMLRAGACAYFTKDLSLTILQKVLLKVCNGEEYISPSVDYNNRKEPITKTEQSISVTRNDFDDREFNVMEYAASGKTDKEISEILGITQKVVEYEKLKVYRKLGARNVAEMVQKSFRLGLIS